MIFGGFWGGFVWRETETLEKASPQISNQSDKLTHEEWKISEKGNFQKRTCVAKEKPGDLLTQGHEINRRRLLPSATHPSDFVLFVFGVTVTQTLVTGQDTLTAGWMSAKESTSLFTPCHDPARRVHHQWWHGADLSAGYFVIAFRSISSFTSRAIRELLRRISFCLFNNRQLTCKKSIQVTQCCGCGQVKGFALENQRECLSRKILVFRGKIVYFLSMIRRSRVYFHLIHSPFGNEALREFMS